jgi:hypothetical protein
MNMFYIHSIWRMYKIAKTKPRVEPIKDYNV